jgi:phosphate transport system permease protein
VSTHQAPVGPSPAIVLQSSRGKTTELIVKVLLSLCALISVLTTGGIVFSLLLPALDFFREVSPVDFFLGTVWTPLFEPASFGALPLITATFTVTGWAMLVAVPAGLGTAIFLSEYASPRARNTLKPIIEILAGVPTVVLGYFALTAVTPLLRSIGIEVEIFNVLSGGLVVGVMLIPTIASLSEDAMSAVPQALRDGSYGLGADKLQTSLRVVVPAAISGIIASFVLAISRAVGETVIALIAIGQLARITGDPKLGAETLTAFIGATGNGDLPTGSIEYKTIFAVGLTLFVITFVMNMIAIRLVRKFREEYD